MEKEFSISSPGRWIDLTVPVAGLTVPIRPWSLTHHNSPQPLEVGLDGGDRVALAGPIARAPPASSPCVTGGTCVAG
ncbi:hypothetical protein O1L55_14555 [Streptomyces albulus]|nr:hypothetical protein [Streptomyces noursei]